MRKNHAANYEKLKQYMEDNPGASLKSALEKFNLPPSSYYKYRAKEKKTVKTAKVVSITGGIQTQSDDKVFCFYGEPSAIIKMMKELQ